MHRSLILIVALLLLLVVPAAAVAADPETKEEEATKAFKVGPAPSGDQCVAVLFAQFKNPPRYRSTSYKTTLQGDDGVGYPATGSAAEAFYADNYDFHGLMFPAPAGMHQVVVSESYRLGGDGNCSDLDARTQQLYPHPVTIVYTKVPTAVVNVTGDQSNAAASQSEETCDVNRALTGLQCTLRAAIELSNKLGGTDINFNIPATGVPRITPATVLPEITAAARIDATTQPGGWVEIVGGDFSIVDGIKVGSGGEGSEIRGLAIHGFRRREINVSASNVTVEGNRIGTDVTGTQTPPGAAISLGGVELTGAGNVLARNVIAGEVTSNEPGASLVFISGDGNRVEGNKIGVGADGRVVPVPPAGTPVQANTGVVVRGSSNLIGGDVGAAPAGSCISPCNLIAGVNAAVAIGGDAFSQVSSSSRVNKVSGNWIGVQSDGTSVFNFSSGGRTVGVAGYPGEAGTEVTANLVYAEIQGLALGSQARIRANRVVGRAQGAELGDAGPNLGLVSAGEQSEVSDNVIRSYTQQGLVVTGGRTTVTRNTISDNPLGGISVQSGTGHVITDNKLTNNQRIGIGLVTFEAPVPSAVLARNEISGSDIGIDLVAYTSPPVVVAAPPWGNAFANDGVTLNDVEDPDTGPNGLLNFPAVLSASTDGKSLSVRGFVEAPLFNPGDYLVEAFTGPSCFKAARGGHAYGTGDHYVGVGGAKSTRGYADFNVKLGAPPAGDRFVALTATRQDQGATSEFSRCVPIADAKSASEYAVKTGQTGTVADGDRAKIEIPAVARSSAAGRGHGAGRLYVTRYDVSPGSGAAARRYWLLADRGLTREGGAAKGKDATLRVCLDTAGVVARAALGKTVIARRSESTGGVWKPLKTELSSASSLCAPGVTALGEFAFLTGPTYKPRKAKLARLTVKPRATKKTAQFRISCSKTALCEGTLRVSAKQGRKVKQIGKAKFAIPAGTIATVKVKLSRTPGKAKPLTITATATTGTSTLTKTTKLKR